MNKPVTHYSSNRKSLSVVAMCSLAALIYIIPAKSQQPNPPASPAVQNSGGASGPAGSRPRGFAGFSHPEPDNFADTEGWTSIWDGKTLNGWSGDSNWKVEDGAITIESTCEKPTGTIYLVWQGGEPADFELKLEMKGEGNINGGIQYRSWIVPPVERPAGVGLRGPTGPCPSGQPRGVPPDPKTEAQWNLAGPQYDFDAANHYTGQFYEQATGRGIVAWRGDAVHTEQGKKPQLIGALGDINELGGYYKIYGWNQCHIVARGRQETHVLNGHVVAMLMDDDASKFRPSGKVGIEVEATGKLYVRNIWLKKL